MKTRQFLDDNFPCQSKMMAQNQNALQSRIPVNRTASAKRKTVDEDEINQIESIVSTNWRRFSIWHRYSTASFWFGRLMAALKDDDSIPSKMSIFLFNRISVQFEEKPSRLCLFWSLFILDIFVTFYVDAFHYWCTRSHISDAEVNATSSNGSSEKIAKAKMLEVAKRRMNDEKIIGQ